MNNQDCQHKITEIKKEEDYEFIILDICTRCGEIIRTRKIAKK